MTVQLLSYVCDVANKFIPIRDAQNEQNLSNQSRSGAVLSGINFVFYIANTPFFWGGTPNSSRVLVKIYNNIKLLVHLFKVRIAGLKIYRC
jgi:hypothetical protein